MPTGRALQIIVLVIRASMQCTRSVVSTGEFQILNRDEILIWKV
jgi:hypothetical protein